MKINKSKFKGIGGSPITQSLFLEIGYTDLAYYTLSDEDKVYKGTTYLSLKRLYLEHEDVTEYDFATTYLLGWRHWQRLCENKQVRKHIDEWRFELELKLRSAGIKAIIESALDEDGGFQAQKYLADKGWDKIGAGRPKKDTSEADKKQEELLNEDFNADILRLKNV
jgi:hypothetical protein